MREVSKRTALPLRSAAAFREVWEAFAPTGESRLLFAEARAATCRRPLLVRCGTPVVEPYGGMTEAGAESRANYLLKWEAIRTSKEQGAASYDMWGLIGTGIDHFKAGFGGREVAYIGAWDLPLSTAGAPAFRLGGAGRRCIGRCGDACAARTSHCQPRPKPMPDPASRAPGRSPSSSTAGGPRAGSSAGNGPPGRDRRSRRTRLTGIAGRLPRGRADGDLFVARPAGLRVDGHDFVRRRRRIAARRRSLVERSVGELGPASSSIGARRPSPPRPRGGTATRAASC